MVSSKSINSGQSSASTDDLPRFNSSIDSGLRSYQFRKNCRTQVCIGKHLVAIASIQSRQGDQAALVLEFAAGNGNIKRCLIRREDLISRGGEKIFASLLARGYYYDLEHQASILVYLSGLGVGLPEIIADEITRIGMELEKLVFPVADTDDIDWIPF
jgi:hypothetical protein